MTIVAINNLQLGECAGERRRWSTTSVIINDLQLGDVRAKAPVIAGRYQRPSVGWMWANGADDHLLL